MSKAPQISIGMPAYNSEAHIGAAIEGILAQSFGDFELIVSDNASTDQTQDVVEIYRKLDRRIRYERQAENIGANPNYTHVARIARGDLFKWSSSSDWCAPRFLEACMAELVSHNDVVLAVPRTRLFEKDPLSFEDYRKDVEVLDHSPSVRLERLMQTLFLNNVMNGVIRRSALRRTRLMQPFYGGDVVLMGHLVLLGKFRLVDERLYYRRMEVSTATAMQDPMAVRRHHYPKLDAGSLLQFSQCQVGWIRVVCSAPMSARERFQALKYVAKRCYWERSLLLDDIRGVGAYLARRTSNN